jgi:hypothetical protein
MLVQNDVLLTIQAFNPAHQYQLSITTFIFIYPKELFAAIHGYVIFHLFSLFINIYFLALGVQIVAYKMIFCFLLVHAIFIKILYNNLGFLVRLIYS